jgi:O-antigen/teichoic acid export membrane protein
MIKNEVGKGAIYVYIQLVSSMVSGYIFFIILARITTTEIIGIFSLVLALSEIFGNIAILGLPDGMQKFLVTRHGKEKGKIDEVRLTNKMNY